MDGLLAASMDELKEYRLYADPCYFSTPPAKAGLLLKIEMWAPCFGMLGRLVLLTIRRSSE
jgi:hypothetical protein